LILFGVERLRGRAWIDDVHTGPGPVRGHCDIGDRVIHVTESGQLQVRTICEVKS